MSKEDRFNLDGIEKNRAKLEQAIVDAKKPPDRSSQKLAALTNLPWLIAGVAALLWYCLK
ncbi:hypothetical protein WAE56_00970 [Iodobacter sp. LRB]|uniref:Uncharacterized protein n=1 Tax=Iodobacter fluviatilis TaxID=537 RepID=A0ABY2C7H1_9NEIS|nr:MULTISPECIES: hypothetical protein [Iodobacter]PHV02684.1 hypothetical protein CSQ88_05540 [Iodobacter sp. BJB302]TCU85611.1 hypothetical protein EV682_107121 [Iodobacter fluviatilis]